MMRLKSATVATTWIYRLPRVGTISPVGRIPRQLQAQHPEVRRSLRPQHLVVDLYIAVKAAGGNFDHMAAYFPLVVCDALSL
jgi:hypothetical protein